MFITTPTLEASALKASATLPEDKFCNYQETQLNGEPSGDGRRSGVVNSQGHYRGYRVIPRESRPGGSEPIWSTEIVPILAGVNQGIWHRRAWCM